MMKKFWTQPLLKQIGTTALASFITHSAIVLIHLYVVSPFGFGGTFLLQFITFLGFPFLLISLAMLVSIFLLPFRKFRRHAVTILICGLIYVSIGLALIRLSGPVRMNGFQRLAIQSRPLIKAIEQFVADEGHPPSTLQDLVPKYLSKIPKTGMPAYPKYNYSTEASRWGGNPWVLYINCTSGGVNFDMFIYFPKQNYPDKGYGGSLERVGKWAYVHE